MPMKLLNLSRASMSNAMRLLFSREIGKKQVTGK